MKKNEADLLCGHLGAGPLKYLPSLVRELVMRLKIFHFNRDREYVSVETLCEVEYVGDICTSMYHIGKDEAAVLTSLEPSSG